MFNRGYTTMVDLLPPFTEQGLLPAGDYTLTLEQLRGSPLVLGGSGSQDWDSDWRKLLLDNLAVMIAHLRRVGVSEIFIDGSFVESKPHPNDIDGYFVCDPLRLYDGLLEAELQQLDPIWTWDPSRRYATRSSGKRQLPMWHKYRVELFPHVGQGSGILDQFGNELEFPSAFRQTRDFQPKGIVRIGGAS